MKMCNQCKQEKDLSAFFKNSYSKDGKHSMCRECQNAKNREKYHANPLRKYFEHKKNKYKVSEQELREALATQKYSCAICQTPFTSRAFGKNYHCVDHDHKTGTFRGFLCHQCNLGLGHFKDDITLFNRAIEYLTRSASKKEPENEL